MVYFNTTLDQLPELGDAAQEHASRVKEYLVRQVNEHDGFIGFDQYMASVLYAPGIGYYSAGSEKFGAGGDYVTAPLISPLFSKTLARFITPYLAEGDEILELGAGTGVMARDIITSLTESSSQAAAYRILEPGADLRQRQRQTLKPLMDAAVLPVSWLEGLNDQGVFDGIIVGNEVIDAMPVQRFVIQAGQIRELGVGIDDKELSLKTREAADEFRDLIQSMLPLPANAYPEGYCGEYRPAVDAWLKAISEYLRSGVLILFDYGFERTEYYRPDRLNGTLRGYYRHFLVEDPLLHPGMIDLTASVDFTQLAEAGVRHGLTMAGYTTQANFLIDHGLAEISHEMLATVDQTERTRINVAEAVKLLTDPGEMGESIKVAVLTRGRDIDTGFSKDLRYRL